MTPQHAHDQRQHLQLVDVRSAAEWAQAHVAGALHLPMEEVPARLAELDRARPVAVLCRTGNRSGVVTEALLRAGFDAHNVEGGLVRWTQFGLPVTTSPSY